MRLKLFLSEEGIKIHKVIIDFIKKNPNPSDDEVHDLAEKMGIDPHDFEEHVYMIMSEIFHGKGENKDRIEGGKADKHTPESIAKKHKVSVEKIEQQLKMGIKVEMEHVDDKALAREISLDHLEEIVDYYTRLDKMEKEAGVDH